MLRCLPGCNMNNVLLVCTNAMHQWFPINSRSPGCFHFTTRCVLRFSLYKDDVQHLLCYLHLFLWPPTRRSLTFQGFGMSYYYIPQGISFSFPSSRFDSTKCQPSRCCILPPLDNISNSRVLQVFRAFTCCPKSRTDDEALVLLFFLAPELRSSARKKRRTISGQCVGSTQPWGLRHRRTAVWSDVADGFYVFGGYDGKHVNDLYLYGPQTTTTTATLTSTSATATSITSTTRTEDRVDRSDNWTFMNVRRWTVAATVLYMSHVKHCRGHGPSSNNDFRCPCGNLHALDGTRYRYGSRMKLPWIVNKGHQAMMCFTVCSLFHLSFWSFFSPKFPKPKAIEKNAASAYTPL